MWYVGQEVRHELCPFYVPGIAVGGWPVAIPNVVGVESYLDGIPIGLASLWAKGGGRGYR